MDIKERAYTVFNSNNKKCDLILSKQLLMRKVDFRYEIVTMTK